MYYVKHLNAYIIDSHTRFENKQISLQFLEILIKQNSSIQYTEYITELENYQKQLHLLDTTVTTVTEKAATRGDL